MPERREWSIGLPLTASSPSRSDGVQGIGMAKTNAVLTSWDSHPLLCRADAPPAAGGGAKGGLRRRRSRPRQYSQYIYKSLRILQPRRRPRRPGAVAHRPGPRGIRPPTRPRQRADRDRAPRVGEGEEASDPPTIWRHRNDARKTGVLDRDRVAGVISATLR